jgi:hypothetical protein
VAVGVRVSERAPTQPTLAAVLDLRSRLAQQLLAWDLGCPTIGKLEPQS